LVYTDKVFSTVFHGRGSIYWFTPIITFGVVVGLALDYDIFLFSRIAEMRRSGYLNHD